MFSFDNSPHKLLDSKIDSLENKVNSVSCIRLTSVKPYEWDEIFELSKDISDDFKKVRYPKREEREEV